MSNLFEAKLYQKTEGTAVQCRLCRNFCQIQNQKTGLCGVRKNINGKLYSLCYGKPAAMNIDPVEKKPLYHFHPGSLAYSLGTYGCSLSCHNCQNYSQSQERCSAAKSEQLDFVGVEKIVENALGDGCDSIAFTYNEPTVFSEYALDIMKSARQNGLKNIWVSNGYMSEEGLEMILPYLDAVNIDLKSMDDDFYRNNCGARLEPVLLNLRRIKNESVHLEISTLVIPTLSDDLGMLESLADFIASDLDVDTPWHISRFSPEISWKLRHLPSTGDDLIYEAWEIGKNLGLKYVYVGNIPGDQKENTYCPSCRELVIRRLGYHVERLDNNGLCPACDRSLDIID